MLAAGRMTPGRVLSRKLSTEGGLSLEQKLTYSYQGSGSGGRSSVSGIVATVFGSTGFLGRYVVHQLGRIGSQVVVPWRMDEMSYRHLKPMGDLGQILPIQYELRDRESVYEACKHSNVIINLIGKHYATNNYTITQSSVESAQIISEVAADLGIEHFVQISHANASPDSKSELLRAKVEAEKVVKANIPTATIVRCTDIFGPEDRFLNRIQKVFETLPVFPVLQFGESKVQPVHALDVSNAIAMVVKDFEGFAGKKFKLAGPEVMKMRDVMAWVFETTGSTREVIEVPCTRTMARMMMLPMSTRLPLINPNPFTSLNDIDEQLRDNVLGVPEADELTFDDFDYAPHGLDTGMGQSALGGFMARRTMQGKLVQSK